MMTSFNQILDSRTPEGLQGVGSEVLLHLQPPCSAALEQAETGNQSELQLDHLLLTPSSELEDHSPALNMKSTLTDSNVGSFHPSPSYTDLLGDDSLEDFVTGLTVEDDFNMNLLTQDVMDTMESKNLDFDVTLSPGDLPPYRFPLTSKRNYLIQDLLVPPSGAFLLHEEDEDGLSGSLRDLLEDSSILESMRLLDQVQGDGLSPGTAEERSHFHGDPVPQEAGGDPRERGGKEDGEDERDSDSGLSLDFSHSPASEDSTSFTSTTSTSGSGASAEESLCSEDEDGRDEDIEQEATVKQEKLDEMGAAGGGCPTDTNQLSPAIRGDRKLIHGFSWLEHVGHDHTYNQPVSFRSSLSWRKMFPKQTKVPLRPDKPKSRHHHSSKTQTWGRDERQVRTFKIPFSSELIVHLPVEEFNDLLRDHRLSGEQLALVRDVRRRGKNKIAAQNCRKRKQDVLLGLESQVSRLRRHHSRLLREQREALRDIREMKHRLGTLYQETLSKLRDEEERLPIPNESLLQFGASDGVTEAPEAADKNSRKRRDEEK